MKIRSPKDFWSGLFFVAGLAIRSIADAAQQSQNQMLTVGFEEEGILVLSECCLDEDIAEFGLESWMKVEFRLFNSDKFVPLSERFKDDWQGLAGADANVLN